MKLQVDLRTEFVPLPDEQKPAWEMAMQTLADMLANSAQAADVVEEIQDGEIVEASYQIA